MNIDGDYLLFFFASSLILFVGFPLIRKFFPRGFIRYLANRSLYRAVYAALAKVFK